MSYRPSRRAFALGGFAVFAVGWTQVLWPRIARGIAPAPEFRAIRGLPGFRRVLWQGAMTGRPGPLVGLDEPAATWPAPIAGDACAALFGAPPEGRLGIALFTDYACPQCRALDPRIFDLVTRQGGDVAFHLHQLPLLGRPSERAAALTLAAGLQGAYIPFHKRLIGGVFSTAPAYLDAIAREMGLDKDKLMQDAKGPQVAQMIAQSRALAARLGVFGTPAVLIGRSLVLGNAHDGLLSQVVAMERALPEAPDCTVFA